MFCAIWYHLHNSKNVKNTHEGVLLLVKLKLKPLIVMFCQTVWALVLRPLLFPYGEGKTRTLGFGCKTEQAYFTD